MRRSPLKLNLSFVNTLKKWHPFCAQEMSKNPVFIGFPFSIPSGFFFFQQRRLVLGEGVGICNGSESMDRTVLSVLAVRSKMRLFRFCARK